MLLQVLLARESMARAAIAVGIWAHQRLLGIDVFLVYFALVSQQATGVCKSLNLIAARFHALIWSVMFIHVFAVETRYVSYVLHSRQGGQIIQ